MNNMIGKMLDNRYELLEVIGSGGMAVVYKAKCHRLNRLVAVKGLKSDLAEDADFRRRFRDEPQAAPGMRRGKGRETRLGVVRGVVAHHHALPLVARKILPHDGFERRNELCGTVVGGNDERDSNHRANVAIYP